MLEGEKMNLAAILDTLGLKGPILAAGLAGGFLRALSHRRWKWREAIFAPICGAIAAGYSSSSQSHVMRATVTKTTPRAKSASARLMASLRADR